MNTEQDYDGEVVAGRNCQFVVVAEYGLVARASGLVVKTLRRMGGEIVIGNGDDGEKDAQSIMDVMSLEMGHGRIGYLRFSETQPAARLLALREVIRIMETEDEN